MCDWLIGIAATILLVAASWGLLILLAKRLPPGIMRELAAFRLRVAGFRGSRAPTRHMRRRWRHRGR
jgi:hypothetical protein